MLSTEDKILVLKSVSIFSTVRLDLEAQGMIARVPGVLSLGGEWIRCSQRMLPAPSTRC